MSQQSNTRAVIYADDPQWRCDPNTPWARFRGRGRRGRQSRSVTDDHDLKIAVGELAEGRLMLKRAHEAYEGRPPTRDEQQAVKVALGRLALASRQIDEVVIRRGGIAGDVLGVGDS